MNDNIMNRLIFQEIELDLKYQGRSHKALLTKFFKVHSFISLKVLLITYIIKT